MRPKPLIPTRNAMQRASWGLDEIECEKAINGRWRFNGSQMGLFGPLGARWGVGNWSNRCRRHASACRCPVSHGHDEILAGAVALGEMLGDGHRAVAPAGAADGDDEVRLALGDVLRQQEVKQRMQALYSSSSRPSRAT